MTESSGEVPSEHPPAEPTDGVGERPSHDPWWDFKASHWVTAGLTLALVFVGVSQTCIYIRQAGIMDRQATIAETQNRIVMEGERAFIFVKEVPWAATRGENGDVRWNLLISWENNGTTQAKHLLVDVYCPNLNQKDDPTKFRPKNWPVLRRTMGPKQETFGGSCVPTLAELQAAQRHEKWFYIVATAVYDDVFCAQHLTEYCQMIDFIEGDLTKPGAAPLHSTSPCQTHNCADDECTDRDQQIATIRAAPKATEGVPACTIP